MITLNTDNNEYKIELNKSLRNSFLLKDSNISDAKYNTNIKIYSNFGNLIYEVNSTDIEILTFIDTIETFLVYPGHFSDIYFSFSIPDSSLIYKMIVFERMIPNNTDISSYGLDMYGKIYMKLYNYINEDMVLVSSIPIDKSIESFLNSLYEEFIIDDNTGTFYNPNMQKFTSIY